MSASKTEIRILTSSDVDRNKWDTCVLSDRRALIYTQYWYLDCMAERWYGLVVNDYESVLALPVKIIAGLKCVYLPAFFQRLELAGATSEAIKREMQVKIDSFSRLITLNTADEFLFKFPFEKRRTNYILNINRPYAEIETEFTRECKKNIRKAVNRNCYFTEDVNVHDVITFYQNAYGAKASYRQKHFDKLVNLAASTEANKRVHIYGVRNQTDHALIFAAMLLDDGNRLYYLLGAPSALGRASRATSFFINEIIRRFAQKRLLFDFEGSDIPDVANFYKGFSPEPEYYFHFYKNRFPKPARAVLDKILK